MNFPSTSTDIVRLSLAYEAGSIYQPRPLVAEGACRLFSDGSTLHTPQQVAEFFDYHGIIMDKDKGFFTADVVVYFLRRYAEETMPLLHELLTSPLFGDTEVNTFRSKMRQSIMAQRHRTSSGAERAFAHALYGKQHPHSRFAEVEDADKIDRDVLLSFFNERFVNPVCSLAGGYDSAVEQQCRELFGDNRFPSDVPSCDVVPDSLANPLPVAERRIHVSLECADTVQSSINVGRIIPLAWHSMDLARLKVLNTLLGGFIGSRLMANIREDKGYTYGIYSSLPYDRCGSVFQISADVAREHTDDAMREIRLELQRLCDEPVSDDELCVVRNYMRGEHIRALDGVFERSSLYTHLASNGITDLYTQNFLDAIENVTPQQLQQLAQTYLNPDDQYWISCC